MDITYKTFTSVSLLDTELFDMMCDGYADIVGTREDDIMNATKGRVRPIYHKRKYIDYMKERLHQGLWTIAAYTRDGRIPVGYATIRHYHFPLSWEHLISKPFKDVAEIVELYVARGYRRNGVAKGLFNEACKYLNRQNFSYVVVSYTPRFLAPNRFASRLNLGFYDSYNIGVPNKNTALPKSYISPISREMREDLPSQLRSKLAYDATYQGTVMLKYREILNNMERLQLYEVQGNMSGIVAMQKSSMPDTTLIAPVMASLGFFKRGGNIDDLLSLISTKCALEYSSVLFMPTMSRFFCSDLNLRGIKTIYETGIYNLRNYTEDAILNGGQRR